jgi:uncharacterized protein YjiS (DUF1127 family)
MATTTTPAVAPLGAVVIHRTVGALSAMIAAIREWNDARRTVAALRWLKADLLDDIGLTRSDVAKFDRAGF